QIERSSAVSEGGRPDIGYDQEIAPSVTIVAESDEPRSCGERRAPPAERRCAGSDRCVAVPPRGVDRRLVLQVGCGAGANSTPPARPRLLRAGTPLMASAGRWAEFRLWRRRPSPQRRGACSFRLSRAPPGGSVGGMADDRFRCGALAFRRRLRLRGPRVGWSRGLSLPEPAKQGLGRLAERIELPRERARLFDLLRPRFELRFAERDRLVRCERSRWRWTSRS